MATVDEWNAHCTTDVGLRVEHATDVSRRNHLGHQQRFATLRDPTHDRLAQPNARIPRDAASPYRDDSQHRLVLEQHHRATGSLEEIERIGKNRVEDVVEIHHRVQRLPRVEQRRVHLDLERHGVAQDPLVHEQPRQAVQVHFLFHRVNAESDREHSDATGQEKRPSGHPLHVVGRARDGERGEADRDHHDDHDRPELQTTTLDHLDRWRVVVHARDARFVADALADLYGELVHVASRLSIVHRPQVEVA